MRALLLVVLRDGTISEVHGGFGGFLGLDVPALAGSNVFEHIPVTDGDALAMYFLDAVGESEETIALPMPFRISVVGVDGFTHPVDVVPSGTVDGDDWSWTVLLMPVALNGSITRSLDLEMAGAPRELVQRMLCEELRVDNANYTSRWLLIDVHDPAEPEVICARAEDQVVADAVRSAVHSGGWLPWDGVGRGETAPLEVSGFPSTLRSMMEERGWQRSIVAPVHVRDRQVAAFVLLGRVPTSYDPMHVKLNVAARIQALVRATVLLLERWSDQDALRLAATTDELTGLDNRRQLLAWLETERRCGSLLYVDVDDFKSVNDRFGHVVGDTVLVEIARRLQSLCRTEDRIGRIGGDEFVVVLPGADDRLAGEIAARIIDRIGEPLDVAGQVHRISVTIGHAPLDAGDPLDAADHAMLQAKRMGRGCHLLASSARH
ncbi:GGDEF domain-containing protein [Ilumatobacter sp.]|uniref:GGDEF domain-containing protein n=2 Tax=Ilumatobacter sp. TaxID=1967498 RepID=UPI0032979DD0